MGAKQNPETAVNARWFALDDSKNWSEKYFLLYSPYWIGIMAWIVASGFYEHMEEKEYMIVGCLIFFPAIIFPLIFPGKTDRNLKIWERHWVKSSIWITILSFIGNYLWTHYFYKLLGATYTFKAHRLNDVPFALYMITFAYFQLYHCGVNVLLRRFCYGTAVAARNRIWNASFLKALCFYSIAVFVLASITAFMETWTIKEFPYYTFKDRDAMYKIGTFCYAIYFYVSFPMFFRMEERVGDRWTISQVIIDSLAACMAVTMILDFWRLAVGTIYSGDQSESAHGVPWL